MRRTGWLLIAGILFLASAVGWLFSSQKAQQLKESPGKPQPLPANINMTAADWEWSHDEGKRRVVYLRAKHISQSENPPRVDVENMEMKLFHKDGEKYDLVKSAKAELRMGENILYSDGDVQITMGLSDDPQRKNRLVSIKTSGVSFETTSGKANTDRRASFVFENSEGSATGASYDPTTQELLMRDSVVLHWKGKGPKSKTMDVEAGHLSYNEAEQKVYLSPWSKLRRGTMTLDAASSIISLDQGEIQLVEAEKAKGVDNQPDRRLEYEAGRLYLHYGDGRVMEKITAEGDAKLVTTSASGRTTVTSSRVDMHFANENGDSLLRTAMAMGNTHVDSEPAPPKGDPQNAPPNRRLVSDTVELIMQPDGKELKTVVTHSPGQIEFLPRTPRQRYRMLTAERMSMQYGARNQLESFRGAKVQTITKGETPKGKKMPNPDRHTSSEDLQAKFNPKSGEMETLEQWNNFRYQEGDRQARAERARMDSAANRIYLDGKARFWDAAGSTDADHIDLKQDSGDILAEGSVTSTRQPEKPAAKPGEQTSNTLLDTGETMQARASRMETKNRNQWIQYRENAVLWQGANRIEAPVVTIDRKQQLLEATGGVFSQFVEKPKSAQGKSVVAPPAIYTLVRAPEMTWNDADRMAYYRTGVQLTRGDLTVNSRELRAWFTNEEKDKKDKDEGSSLERAVADGSAVIVQTAKDRTRRGTGEHAEFEVKENKVTMTGGAPVMADSLKGTTTGAKLTWFSDNDSLLIDGEPSKPAVSHLKRKKQKPASTPKP